jgi:hypothetical protein
MLKKEYIISKNQFDNNYFINLKLDSKCILCQYKLVSICKKCKLIYQQFNTTINIRKYLSNCSIIVGNCGHSFHNHCLNFTKNINICPICEKKFDIIIIFLHKYGRFLKKKYNYITKKNILATKNVINKVQRINYDTVINNAINIYKSTINNTENTNIIFDIIIDPSQKPFVDSFISPITDIITIAHATTIAIAKNIYHSTCAAATITYYSNNNDNDDNNNDDNDDKYKHLHLQKVIKIMRNSKQKSIVIYFEINSKWIIYEPLSYSNFILDYEESIC